LEQGIEITIGPGELVDRLTILRLRAEHVGDPILKVAIARQLDMLERLRDGLQASANLRDTENALGTVNAKLWNAEDKVRELVAKGDLGAAFVSVARSILELNDERSRLKTRIDELFKWSTTDFKCYSKDCDKEN